MDPSLFPDGQCRLMLIGKTGNGKSATGNTILGYRAFQPHVGINSGTKNGDLKSVERDGIQIQVLDTPGLHDTEEFDEVIMRRITRSLLAISPGPHAIILCLSCESRFTKEEMMVLNTLKHTFGEAMMSYLIVVMVKKDALETDGIKFEVQLEQCTELKKLMTAVDNRYVLFDNRPEVDPTIKETQVQVLLQKVKEVVGKNNGSCFRHKMSADMDASLLILKHAEQKRAEQQTLSAIAQEANPRPCGPFPQMPPASTSEGNTEKTFMRLKNTRVVSMNRKLFETKTHNPDLGMEGSAARRRRHALNRSDSSSNPDLTLRGEESGARDMLNSESDPDISSEATAAILTLKDKKTPPPRPPPGPISPKPPSDRETRAADDNSQQGQNRKPPEKPPRVTPLSAEEPKTPSARELLQRLEMQPQDSTRQVAEHGSAPRPTLVYTIPDKPGMSKEQMRALVEETLKRKLAQGEGLTEEQEEEVEKVSRSVKEKIQEGMRKFSVKTLGKCSVM